MNEYPFKIPKHLVSPNLGALSVSPCAQDSELRQLQPCVNARIVAAVQKAGRLQTAVRLSSMEHHPRGSVGTPLRKRCMYWEIKIKQEDSWDLLPRGKK